MGKREDAVKAGEHVAEHLAQERPVYNAEALARHQAMLADTAKQAGYSDEEIQAGQQALQRCYQERTKP